MNDGDIFLLTALRNFDVDRELIFHLISNNKTMSVWNGLTSQYLME